MARIWIINPYEPLPQEGAVRLRYAHLCAELAARGHAVTWWSADWAHDRKVKRGAVAEAHAPGYAIRMLPVPEYRRNISLARVLSHRAFARRFQEEGISLAEAGRAPDLILFSVPPMEAGKAALALGKRFGAKVVLDVMDAWPETLVQTIGRSAVGRALARAVLAPYEDLMRRYCREADAVCAQSRAFAEFARSKGTAAQPAVFYLGAEPVERPDKPACDSGEITLAYIGSMGAFYDLETLIEAAIRMGREDAGFRMVLVGEGEQRVALERRVAASGCGGAIRFTGYLQGEAYEQALASARIGVIAMRPESNVAIPYKAGEYLARGMVVLNTLPGELQAHLDAAQCGIHYTAGDADSLQHAMRTAITNCRAEGPAIARRACALFDRQFDRVKITRSFADWLEHLAQPPPMAQTPP
jgi:glycosyltransferase involved in cell wall biosynthesis